MRRAGQPVRRGAEHACQSHNVTSGYNDRIPDAGGILRYLPDADDNGTRTFRLYIRHDRRSHVCQVPQSFLEEQDQSHGRSGGHIGVPDGVARR